MTKKTKKYAGGGLSEIADNAQSMMSSVDDLASNLKYGNAGSASAQPIGFSAITNKAAAPAQAQGLASMSANNPNLQPRAYRKGGSVSSASNRADGIAQRGKTRGKVL